MKADTPMAGTWRPIEEADRSIAHQITLDNGLKILYSERQWVRDEDGRTYEASWHDGGPRGRDYWWDWEGERPVTPTEFMPHPLDPRYSVPDMPFFIMGVDHGIDPDLITADMGGTIFPMPTTPGAIWVRNNPAPADVIGKIFEVATAVGFQSGEPAAEAAGQIISVLGRHPEHIERFMKEGSELFIDGTFNPENGALTYRSQGGDILHPSVLRAKKGMEQ